MSPQALHLLALHVDQHGHAFLFGVLYELIEHHALGGEDFVVADLFLDARVDQVELVVLGEEALLSGGEVGLTGRC